jgi:hypothetical protein
MSFLMTYMARHRAQSRNDLVAHMTRGSFSFQHLFGMLSHGAQDPASKHRALAQMQMMADGQANVLSFVSAFFFMGLLVAAMIPLTILMKRPGKADTETASTMVH